MQQACHKAGSDILEGEGGAVEQLEAVDAGLHLYNRAVKLKSVADNPVQVGLRNVFAEKCFRNRAGNLLKRHIVDAVEKRLRQFLYPFGHIQPPVGSKSFHHCLAQRNFGRFSVGAIIFHDLLIS